MKFKIESFDAKNIGEARATGEITTLPCVPPDALDSDFLVRVVGRCVEGPKAGKKADKFFMVTEDLMRDQSAYRSFVESSALAAFERLA